MSFWRRLFGSAAPAPKQRLPDESQPLDPDADYLFSLLAQSARSSLSDVGGRVGDVAFFAAVNRLCERGQERLAADLLGRFVMLRPDHPLLLDRLAALLESTADLEGAQVFYRKLTAFPEAENRARLHLAEIHLRRGERSEARSELEHILATDIRFPGIRERLAELTLAQPNALATIAGPIEVMTLGRYRLRGELGRGGAGIVYRAYDPSLQREVAVKMLYQSHNTSEEVELVARLRHPNLIAVYDFDLPSGVLVMELCRGGSLRRARLARLAGAELARVLAALASALQFLHEAAIVHGDLTPDNVLFRDTNEEPVLTDFGLAQKGAPSGERAGGTAGFVAPEVRLRGERSPASDVFSFGALVAWTLQEAKAPIDESLIAALCAPTPEARPKTSELVGLVKQLVC